MASLARDTNGTKRILFTDANRKRRAIRLGKVPVKVAESFKANTENLIACRRLGTAIDPQTTQWLAELSDELHERLERVGLVEAREAREVPLMSIVLDAFFCAAAVKPATATRMQQARTHLEDFFGSDRDASSITADEADEWRQWLVDAEYAPATISRTVRYARQFASWAVKRGFITADPFAELRAGPQTNPARSVFIEQETIERVIEEAPNAEWRLLIALSRYCGLRVPSEALALTWADVDWKNFRLTVRSSKTEHHEGGASRIVPLFPEVHDHLMAVYEQAEEGAVHVITSYRKGSNLNPQFRRIIERAGFVAWPKTWHNLRASRQSELARDFPLHTVCAWIGNTKAIAAGHYLQVTDADWQRAVSSGAESGARVAHIPAQHPTASKRTESQKQLQVIERGEVVQPTAPRGESVQHTSMGRGGLETSHFSPCKTPNSKSRGAESGALSTDDPRLTDLAAVWPSLSEAAKTYILAFADTESKRL